MKNYRVTIAEALTYKQFVCDISAKSETEAKTKAMEEFSFQHYQYRNHSKVIIVSEILY